MKVRISARKITRRTIAAACLCALAAGCGSGPGTRSAPITPPSDSLPSPSQYADTSVVCQAYPEFEKAVAIAASTQDRNQAVAAWQDVQASFVDIQGGVLPSRQQSNATYMAKDVLNILDWIATTATQQELDQQKFPPQVRDWISDFAAKDQALGVYVNEVCKPS